MKSQKYGKPTIKCRITNDTTGASIIVTDDYVARTTVAAVRVSEKRFYDVLAEFPSITGDLDLKTPCKHLLSSRCIPNMKRLWILEYN